MIREDYQMARNLIEDIEQYKNMLKSINNTDLYLRIGLTTTSGHEQVRINNSNIIGEEEQKRLNHLVREDMRYFLKGKIDKLERELDEL